MENRGESTKPRDKDLHGGPSVSQSHTEMANLSDWKCLNQEKTPHSQQPSHPRLYCSSVKKIATLRSFHKAGFWHMIIELALWVYDMIIYVGTCRYVIHSYITSYKCIHGLPMVSLPSYPTFSKSNSMRTPDKFQIQATVIQKKKYKK